jgi:hypothetical protein
MRSVFDGAPSYLEGDWRVRPTVLQTPMMPSSTGEPAVRAP